VPLPAEDVALVREFVDSLNADMPAHVASQLRYRLDTDRNALTMVECRAAGELYWPDRDSDFHIYESTEPTQDVRLLFAEINSDPTGIFFG
jgi:hypothetical protein